ncbi:MAG: translocation/assembly module TamB domain-containing protein, partial [Acidobacteriota bacterium]
MAGDTGKDRRRWRRWLALALLVLVLLPVVVAGAALVGLRSAGLRRALLDRLLPALEERSGIRLEARDFRLDPRAGRLELLGLNVGAREAPPLLSAARLEVTVDLRSLTSDTLVVETLTLDGARIDATAPLPALPAAAPAPPGRPSRSVTIRHAALHDVAIVPGLVPAAAAQWVTAWQAEGITLTGSYVAGEAQAEVTIDSLRIERAGGIHNEVRVAARLHGEADGTWRIEDLRLSGTGLDLTASLAGGPGAETMNGTFAASLAPATLAPELHTAGTLTAQGGFVLPARTGRLAVQARGLSAEALRGRVDAALFDRLAAAGTTFDLTADLEADVADPAIATGTAELTWWRDALPLARASLELPPRQAEQQGVSVLIAASLLPEAAGERSFAGRISAPAWQELAAGTLADATLRLRAPNLAAALAELRGQWPALVPTPDSDLPVRGALELEAAISGPLASPEIAAAASWLPGDGSKVTLPASGRPLAQEGEARLAIAGLRLATLRPDLAGTVSGTVMLAGSRGQPRISCELAGEALALSPDLPTIDTLELHASADRERLLVHSLSAAIGESRLTGAGEARLTLPLREARLDLHLDNPHPVIAAADIHLTLRDGALAVDVPGIDTAAGSAALSAVIPLAALRHVPAIAGKLAGLPVVMADGPVLATLAVPEVDSCTLLPLLGLGERPERLRAGGQALLWLDLADLTASAGQLQLTSLAAESQGHRISTLAPVNAYLAGRRLEVKDTELLADETSIGIQGAAELAPAWRPGVDPPSALLAGFTFQATGTLDSALLNPYLAGGIASGALVFEVDAGGTPAQPFMRASIFGPDAMFFWPTPYSTRLERPDLEISYAGGLARLESATASLNSGTLAVTGQRDGAGAVELAIRLDGVRYRLDYGLSTSLGGALHLSMPPTGRGQLSGEVVIERGLLTRDINLDRELLARFTSPPATTGTETGLLDTIDLDIALRTSSGVRVKNNVADLRVKWDDLAVKGTAWNPAIVGQAEVEPGGLVYAYGQTLRLDRAVFTFTGNPLTDPEIEMETTTSLEDASLSRLPAESNPLSALAEGGESRRGAGEQLATGVAGYFGERLTSGLAESLGLGRVSLRPLLVFGEADPGARLTLSRELSANVTFAVSLDLRNAQRQTYLLDLHGLRALPSLAAQAFTTDAGNPGATLQQSLAFGGPRRQLEEGVRLSRIRLVGPKSLPRRAVRAAIGLRRGDHLRADAAFDIEVEVAALLRERGYPNTEVAVTTRPAKKRTDRAELVVTIDPGPKATFVFAGDRPSAASRALIASLYRADFFEQSSLAEMRRATVRALRGAGFLDPEVEVEAASAQPDDPAGERIVTITAQGGRRVALGPPRFLGLPEADAALLAGRFPTALERAELACAEPDADRRVAESLRVLGYPAARIRSRSLDETGATLIVAVETGPRDRVAKVELRGLPAAGAERLLSELPLHSGDPLRADRVALAALAVENRLKEDGFAGARVLAVVAQRGPGMADVILDARPGAVQRVGKVELSGLRWTSESLARRQAGIGPDDLFRARELTAASHRLAGMGVFSAVGATASSRPDGGTDITFAVAERPRFTLGYGLRWESGVGAAGVVDAVDHNLLGRSITLGVRALWKPDDRLGKLYVGASDLLGSRAAIDAFAESRRKVEGNILKDSLEGSVQLSHPLGAHATGRVYGAYLDRHLTEVEPDPFEPIALDIRLKVPYLGVQLIYDTRADPLLADRGLFASADLSGSHTFLGSDFRYVRLFTQVNLYRPISLVGRPGATWAQSVRLGLAKPFGQELVSDVRFFAGGEYSVRGYATETLGPLEDLGAVLKPTGGEALLVVNEELRFPLFWDLTGLVFVD